MLTPLKIAALIRETNFSVNCCNQLVWIGRRFLEECGTCEGEGGWIRSPAGVIFRPDKESTAYTPHDPLDWMWTQSHVNYTDYAGITWTLAWSELLNLSTYRAVTFTLSSLNVVDDPVPTIIERNTTLEIEVPRMPALKWMPTFLRNFARYWITKLMQWFPRWMIVLLGALRLRAYKPMLKTVAENYQASSKSSITHKKITGDLVNYAREDPDYRLLNVLFPGYFSEDYGLIAMNLMLQNVDQTSSAMETMIAGNLDNINLYNLNTSSQMTRPRLLPEGLPESEVSWKPWVLAVGTGLVLFKYGPTVLGLARQFFASRRLVPASLRLDGILVEEIQNFLTSPLYLMVIGPLWEEFVKGYVGCVPFGIFEFFVNLCNGVALYPALSPLLLHIATSGRNYLTRSCMHIAYNTAAVGFSVSLMAPGQSLEATFATFVERYFCEGWEEKDLEESPAIYAEAFSPQQGIVLKPNEPRYDPPAMDETLQLVGTWPSHEEPTKHKVYWTMPTNMPGYVPTNTDATLLAAVRARVLARPPLDPLIQRRNWSRFTTWKTVVNKWPKFSKIDWEEEVITWLDHFDSSRRRKYRHYVELYKREGYSCFKLRAKRTDLFVKTNEMLFRVNGVRMELKPRIIVNVAPEVQVLVGPEIFKAQQRLKDLWDFHGGRPTRMRIGHETFNVHFTYAGAATDALLSLWMRHVWDMPRHTIYIIVSGDDSLVVVRSCGVPLCFEGDAKMYDQSQSFGPLRFERVILNRLGVPQATVELLRILAGNTYVLRSRNKVEKLTIDKRNRPLRDTGGSDTSLGNSINMAFSWLFSLCYCEGDLTVTNVRAGFLFLGFDMKIKLVPLDQATFLKGLWYYTEMGPYWGPLPSRFLKFGKAVVDPRLVYGISDYREACLRYMHDLACGFEAYVAVPLLRKCVAQFKRDRGVYKENREWLGVVAESEVKPALLDSHKEQLALHYNVEYSQFESLENLITSAFTFLNHPLCQVLAKVDYS